MSDQASREWRFYIDDMISFGDKVVALQGVRRAPE
jgi:hypothetical protein